MGKKILIVDDNKEDLKTMQTLLEKEGYDVIVSTNGADAFDLIKDYKFNLIAIDIQMPTLSGYDLLRLLREKINHHIPMIFVSIIPKTEVNLEDVDGFIQKPFGPEEFIKHIKIALKKKVKK